MKSRIGENEPENPLRYGDAYGKSPHGVTEICHQTGGWFILLAGRGTVKVLEAFVAEIFHLYSSLQLSSLT